MEEIKIIQGFDNYLISPLWLSGISLFTNAKGPIWFMNIHKPLFIQKKSSPRFKKDVDRQQGLLAAGNATLMVGWSAKFYNNDGIFSG